MNGDLGSLIKKLREDYSKKETGKNGLSSHVRKLLDAVTNWNPKFYYQRTSATNIWAGKRKAVHPNEKGAPDYFIVFDGKYEGWELKTKDGKQSPDQLEHQKRIETAGAPYKILRTFDQVIDRLNELGVI